MWTNLTNIGRRARLFGCIGTAALVMSAGTIALAQDRGSYRDRGDRYERATSSSDVRARTRSNNNTRPEYRSPDASRSTVVRNRPAAPQYRHIDRGRDYRDSYRSSYRDSYRGNHYRPSRRYDGSSVRVINQINIGSGYSYHRPYRPVTYHRPNFHYVKPYYKPYRPAPVVSYHADYYAPRHRYFDTYHGGSRVSIHLGSHYRPYTPVRYVPRIGFGIYSVSSSSSFGVNYSYSSSSYRSSYESSYYSRPGYTHRVVSYSDYAPRHYYDAPRSSTSITVRYNYRR